MMSSHVWMVRFVFCKQKTAYEIRIIDWSSDMCSSDRQGDPAVASTEVLGYAYQMADARRTCPADDIVTTLVQADIDGDSLSPEEIGFFVLILAVAGARTSVV